MNEVFLLASIHQVDSGVCWLVGVPSTGFTGCVPGRPSSRKQAEIPPSWELLGCPTGLLQMGKYWALVLGPTHLCWVHCICWAHSFLTQVGQAGGEQSEMSLSWEFHGCPTGLLGVRDIKAIFITTSPKAFVPFTFYISFTFYLVLCKYVFALFEQGRLRLYFHPKIYLIDLKINIERT